MINLKPTILNALTNDTALNNYVNGAVYLLSAPNAKEFPRITFFEMNNYGSNYADNQEISSDISFQIDIWSKEDTTDISVEVERVMKSIDFVRTYSTDLYESDTKIYHKVMRFKTTYFGG